MTFFFLLCLCKKKQKKTLKFCFAVALLAHKLDGRNMGNFDAVCDISSLLNRGSG